MRRPALVALLVLLAPFAALAQPSDWTQIVTAVTPTVARVEVRDFVEDYLPGAKHPAKPKGEK